VQQVVESVQDAANKLRRHDIFSNIEVVLDTAKETTDAIDVVLKLEEKGRTVVKTNAEIANDEANVVSAHRQQCIARSVISCPTASPPPLSSPHHRTKTKKPLPVS
jgi:uncharacterized protein YjcR